MKYRRQFIALLCINFALTTKYPSKSSRSVQRRVRISSSFQFKQETTTTAAQEQHQQKLIFIKNFETISLKVSVAPFQSNVQQFYIPFGTFSRSRFDWFVLMCMWVYIFECVCVINAEKFWSFSVYLAFSTKSTIKNLNAETIKLIKNNSNLNRTFPTFHFWADVQR